MITVTDNDDLAARLGETDLFSGVPHKVLKHLAGSGEIQEFAAGETVTAEGASVGGLAPFSRTGVFFHLALSGSGEVRQGGKQIASIKVGDYFGELSLIDGEPRSADVVAGEDGLRTFALNKWAFETLLEEHPEVAVPMLHVLAARLRAVETRH
jgi:CRP/FNR family transcriptional regulator, cyclic AMP receptor protein